MFASFILAFSSLLSPPAAAECREPVLAVQVEQRKKLEGEVQAGVAMFSGGASGAKESQASWQANLPSQSMVDNQMKLYLLCVEYEAGRLPRDAYCEASAGIWETIVGRPIPVEGCVEQEVTPANAVPSAVGSNGSTRPPAPVAAAVAVEPAPVLRASDSPADPAPVNPQPGREASPDVWASQSHHWVLPEQANYQLELWGPLIDEDGSTWLVFNGECLSALGEHEGKLVEHMLLDRRSCSAWSSITIEQRANELLLTADGSQFLFSPTAGPPQGAVEGTWKGEFYGKLPPRVRPLTIEFAGEHATVAWTKTGCLGNWVRDTSETEFMQFTERVNMPLLCSGGATVTADHVSSDTLVLRWELAGIATVWGLARQ